jgi:hypothetical protein
VPLVLTNKGHAAAAALKVAISNPYVAVGAAQRISSRSSGTGGAEALRDVLPPGWLDTWPSLAGEAVCDGCQQPALASRTCGLGFMHALCQLPPGPPRAAMYLF